MKYRKIVALISSGLVFMIGCALTACKKDVDPVVITVENATENQTLLSYMEALKSQVSCNTIV
jgi:hypothetical protein